MEPVKRNTTAWSVLTPGELSRATSRPICPFSSPLKLSYEPQDRQGTWNHRPAASVRPRRRGDRVVGLLVHPLLHPLMAVIGHIASVLGCLLHVRCWGG